LLIPNREGVGQSQSQFLGFEDGIDAGLILVTAAANSRWRADSST
jgi:hypothetical protein